MENKTLKTDPGPGRELFFGYCICVYGWLVGVRGVVIVICRPPHVMVDIPFMLFSLFGTRFRIVIWYV